MNNPPISEFSIAVQFEGRMNWTPLKAIEFFNRHKDQFPNLEFKVRLGPLGGPQVPIFEETDDLVPRYWYVSADDGLIVQVQNDLVAVNWRRRPQVGTPSTPYPGFEKMRDLFFDVTRECLNLGEIDEDVPVSVCNLFYDNIWPAPELVAEIFPFWKPIGIAVRQGPQVSFSIALDEAGGGPGSRIDITAAKGSLLIDDKMIGSARVSLAGYARPTKLSDVNAMLEVLHQQIAIYMPKLVTTSVRDTWS